MTSMKLVGRAVPRLYPEIGAAATVAQMVAFRQITCCGCRMESRLLVATGDDDVRAALLRALENDFSIEIAGEGHIAISVAADARPDVLFVDQRLPAVRELIDAIRSNPEARHIPVVQLVSRGEPGVVDGIDDFLVMPAEPTEIIARVRTLLELSHLRRAAYRGTNAFLGMIGHELRNPLSALATALQALSLRAPSRETELMTRATSRLTKLVDDLLDVSRLSRGMMKLETRVVELAHVVDHALEVLSSELGDRSVSVRVPRVGLRVEADPERLARVVANVVQNAAQHSTAPAGIAIEAERHGERVRLRIQDFGEGIATEDLASAFDALRTLRTSNGLGMGLAIARGIIELHGGTIQLSSAGKGQGAECTLELPTTNRSAAIEAVVPT